MVMRMAIAGCACGSTRPTGLVYKEFHADGGVVENGYDVFGLKRFTKDELLRLAISLIDLPSR